MAIRRRRRRTCRAAKEALVAMMRVGVGPAVKMDWKRSVRKLDMLALDILWIAVMQCACTSISIEYY